jgi:signal transduction histidine kinase
MLSFYTLYKRIRFLRVALPITVIALVAVYLLGPARWIHNSLGLEYHMLVELIFFGSLGPLVAFLVLDLLSRWIEERQTSELQARVLEEARADAHRTRLLSDNALQAIFAASIQLASLRKQTPDLPPEASQALDEANHALQRAVHPLRSYLEKQPPMLNGGNAYIFRPVSGEFPYREQ